jgi:6-pyruvoyl-tetrahydropterin synthase
MAFTFIIGHNKMGTRMLHSAFSNSGHLSCHWDRGKLARTIHRNLTLSLPPLAGYDRYEVFSDIECTLQIGTNSNKSEYLYQPYKSFPQLAAYYPDSIFIYNRRNVNAWIKSRLRHGNGYYAMIYLGSLIRETSGMLCSINHLIEHWHREWLDHDNLVKKFAHMNPSRIITIDIEDIDLDALNHFLSLNDRKFVEPSSFNREVGKTLQEEIDFEHLEKLAKNLLTKYQKTIKSI